jgi:hypothetical protein
LRRKSTYICIETRPRPIARLLIIPKAVENSKRH